MYICNIVLFSNIRMIRRCCVWRALILSWRAVPIRMTLWYKWVPCELMHWRIWFSILCQHLFPDFLQFPKCFPSFSMLVFRTFIVSFSHVPKYWRQSTTSTFWSMEFRSMELKGFFKSTNTAIKGRFFESHH